MNDLDRVLERAFTPYPVIRAGLGEALEHVSSDLVRALRRPGADPERPRVLDWCAGAGPWASVVRELWPGALITAVEIYADERPHLMTVADRVVIGDWSRALEDEYDIVVGNPAFSLIPGMQHGRLASAPVLRLLRRSPIVIALHTIEVLQRSVAGRRLARYRPPKVQIDLPGGIQFRGRGQDLRSYAVYAWSRYYRGPGWLRVPLSHDLAPAERSWCVRPGTEPR